MWPKVSIPWAPKAIICTDRLAWRRPDVEGRKEKNRIRIHTQRSHTFFSDQDKNKKREFFFSNIIKISTVNHGKIHKHGRRENCYKKRLFTVIYRLISITHGWV